MKSRPLLTIPAPLDREFQPAVMFNRRYVAAAKASGNAVPLVIGLERDNGLVSRFETLVRPDAGPETLRYVERLVKFLLWARGGWKLYLGGPKPADEFIRKVYSAHGERKCDCENEDSIPFTRSNLRKGNYRACSRNPVIAQALATLKLMEQRGSGFARMHDAMLNHGLDAPAFSEHDGYFVVTFPGPNGNYGRLKVAEGTPGLVSPAIEAQLNARQRKITARAMQAGSVTTGWCMKALKIARDTAHRDLAALVRLKILVRIGSGRSAVYVPQKGDSSAEIIR